MSNENLPHHPALSSDSKAELEKSAQWDVHTNDEVAPENRPVHRDLKSRHLQMIALGGTIGTGLFVGTGATLSKGGPLGMILGYSVMGAIVFSMMVALGEMVTLYPVPGAFSYFAGKFVDPALGFAVGYNYWYASAITLPTQIVAAALVIQYWPGGESINPGAWVALFLFVIVIFNFCGVRYYGEAEFWFSVVKITTILGLFLLGIIITCGGIPPNHETIGFRYWHEDGPFQTVNHIKGHWGHFLAFWSTLTSAAFSYLSTEMVALTAAEAENPRRNVPKAIRRVFARILFFYVFGVFLLGLLVSAKNPALLTGVGAAKSGWVLATKDAGIKVLPSIVNTVILLSAFSAGNTDLFAGSRVLYGLACDGRAPPIFKKVTKGGLPIYCLIFTAAIGLLGFMTCGKTSVTTAFNELATLKSILGLITWATILASYLRFFYAAKLQQVDRNTFPYKAPFQPYLSWFGLVMILLVITFNGYTVFLDGEWNASTFVVSYIGIPIFALFFVFWKVWKRSRLVPLAEIDFVEGRRVFDVLSDEYDEVERAKGPRVWYMRVWDAVM